MSRFKAVIKEKLGSLIGLGAVKFEASLQSDGIFSEIDKMRTRIKNQIDKYKDNIEEINERQNRLEGSKEEMKKRVNKLSDLEGKVKDLV